MSRIKLYLWLLFSNTGDYAKNIYDCISFVIGYWLG